MVHCFVYFNWFYILQFAFPSSKFNAFLTRYEPTPCMTQGNTNTRSLVRGLVSRSSAGLTMLAQPVALD